MALALYVCSFAVVFWSLDFIFDVVLLSWQQIIREEEEPEQFLNHLFSLHREKESNCH